MRYVASPILASLEGVHDVGLADEDTPAAPSQQDRPFACEIAATPSGIKQLRHPCTAGFQINTGQISHARAPDHTGVES